MDQDQGAGIDGEYAFQIGGSGQYIPFVAVEFTAVDGQVAGGFQIGLAVHRCRGGVDIQLAVQVQHAVHGQVEPRSSSLPATTVRVPATVTSWVSDSV